MLIWLSQRELLKIQSQLTDVRLLFDGHLTGVCAVLTSRVGLINEDGLILVGGRAAGELKRTEMKWMRTELRCNGQFNVNSETYQQVRAPPPQVLIELPPFDAQSVWEEQKKTIRRFDLEDSVLDVQAENAHLFRSNRCRRHHFLLHRRCSSIAEWTVIPVWRHGSALTERTANRR